MRNAKRSRKKARTTAGFTLVELLMAAAVFLIIASTAFSLFNQHLVLANRQENLSSVNIGIRNAMAQMEMDLAAGGQNVLGGVQTGAPVFGVGVSIQNNVPNATGVPTCQMNPDWSYPIPSACYDAMTIYMLKPCSAAGGTTAPVLVISDPGNSQESLSSSSIIWGNDPNTGASLSNDSSCFKNGDEILVVQFPNTGQSTIQCDNNAFNYCMAVVTLTKDAQVSGGKIELQHNPTGAGSDPLGLLNNGTTTNSFTKANGLGIGYNNGAFIVDLGTAANTVSYSVQANPNNAADPQLVRCTNNTCTAVADQVIGFKIGAALWDSTQSTDLASYYYNAANYCSQSVTPNPDCSTSPQANDPYDFSLVRAIRLSLIARTPPASDQSVYNFKNGFDGGPYLVQQGAIVVDLRNMSNNEFDN